MSYSLLNAVERSQDDVDDVEQGSEPRRHMMRTTTSKPDYQVKPALARSRTQLDYDQSKQDAVKRVLHARQTGPRGSEAEARQTDYGTNSRQLMDLSDDFGEWDASMDALHNLVSHVRFDPDGGLENVVGASDFLSTGALGQVSKVEHLKKDAIELFGAFSVVGRVLANICFVLWRCDTTLMAVFFPDHSLKSMELHKRQQEVRIPHIMELTAMVAIFELCCLTYLVLAVVLRSCRVAWMWRRSETRYFHLAKLFWSDLLQLTNVSALKALGYVHPTILAKRKQSLFTGDLCARLMLTKFFNAKEDQLSSEEMAVQVGKIVLRANWANLTSFEERQRDQACCSYAVSSVDASPYSALSNLTDALNSLSPQQRQDILEGVGADASVLERCWRIRFILLVETLLFMVSNMILLLIGLSGAVVKVSAGAVVLTDPDAPQQWVYFWIAAFCNQLIGVFPIEELLMARVHTFVFGGTDARVQMEERYLIDLYMGHLMQRIWESDPEHLTFSNKLALLFKLDDDDMQQLIVEEDYGQKSLVTTAVHKHLRQHKLQGFGNQVKERLGRWASKME